MPRSVSLSARPSCCGRCMCVCLCVCVRGRRGGGRTAGEEGGMRGRAGAALHPCAGAGREFRGAGLRRSLCVCKGWYRACSLCGCVCASPYLSLCPRAEQLPRPRGESPSSPREELSSLRCVYTHHLLRNLYVFFPFPKDGEPSDFTSSFYLLDMCFVIISQSLRGHPGALLVLGRE